ncbi:hypothetical protein MY3296_002818 [Beauveria thailandica]
MKPSSPRYEPLSLRDTADDGCGGSSPTPEKRLSCEDDSSASLLRGSDNLPAQASPQPSSSSLVRRLGLYLSLALALLAAANIALLLATLSVYRDSHPLKVQVANPTTPQTYHRAWPDRIVRVSRKLKKAVWGQSVQVYVTVEDSTIMRFPLPPGSGSGIGHACALSWRAPPELSGRAKDLTTKGDVSEVEVWQLIAPSATAISAATPPSTMDELDYDTLSYSTLPVRGELLGVLNLSEKPSNTTAEFACPSGTESLVVEMRCQRVACHVSFMQIDLKPSFGFELLSRKS